MKLSDQEKNHLRKLLPENLNVFAWSPTDRHGVDPSVICHRLSSIPETKPIKQKPQKMNVERLQALNKKVDQLLKTGFIRETLYPNRLANPILVKKKNKK